MQLHPSTAPLSFLLGTWRGKGSGSYPTIESFDYVEEVTFSHVGKPFLSYFQKTRDANSGQPLHAEAGYLRAIGATAEDGSLAVELLIAQPSGIAELHSGRVVGTSIDFVLDGVHTTPAAKSVTDVQRKIAVDQSSAETVLVYDIAMAAVGEPLTHHLHAELTLQPDQ